jgi:hypothetical protein
MQTVLKKSLFAVVPLAGLLFLPPIVSAHDSHRERQRDRREYRHDLRQVHREYHRDLNRAHREFHRDLRQSRRDYSRDRRDCDRRSSYRGGYYRNRYSDDNYRYYYPRPFYSGIPQRYNPWYR